MGTWSVDTTTEPGILRLKLEGRFTPEEMREFVRAHNGAVDSFGGRDYKVWVDLSKLTPLSPECAEILEESKRYSNAHRNFRGSAVLVSTATVALQHRRTSVESGVMPTELISHDPTLLREHLNRVYRTR